MANEGARDGMPGAHNVSSGTDDEPGTAIELKPDVTSGVFATPLSSDAGLETGATVPVLKEEEVYSVFSKRQRILILIMTVLGAIISPISGQI